MKHRIRPVDEATADKLGGALTMSMEHRVFFRGQLPGTAELTACMQELGFPITVVPPHYSLEEQSHGFRPMFWEGKETGIELIIDEGRECIEEVASECLTDIDPTFDRTASFRFVLADGNYEFLCMLCAAAALAKLVNGIVYEEQEGVLWPIDKAIEETRKIVANVLKEIAEGPPVLEKE